MNITSEKSEHHPNVSIIRVSGDLDASSYMDLIHFANARIEEGAQNILLDLGDMKFMSSAGLVALHSIIKLFRKESLPDPEAGWSAIHSISHEVERATGFEPHFKLLNPQARVSKTLAVTGFDKLIQVFTDQQTALASFSA